MRVSRERLIKEKLDSLVPMFMASSIWILSNIINYLKMLSKEKEKSSLVGKANVSSVKAVFHVKRRPNQKPEKRKSSILRCKLIDSKNTSTK
mmetsp:Transcript_24080/g.35018  ORF Transcript_24080/g.35018 Transcript_24080/m.35018 type:complete len:92 (+) Transcript_24080:480-755(+)